MDAGDAEEEEPSGLENRRFGGAEGYSDEDLKEFDENRKILAANSRQLVYWRLDSCHFGGSECCWHPE